MITPTSESWDVWFDRDGVSKDFMPEREQPDDQEECRLHFHVCRDTWAGSRDEQHAGIQSCSRAARGELDPIDGAQLRKK